MTNVSGNGQQPPGFYRDNQGTMRWWDGRMFTERTQNNDPRSAGAPRVAPPIQLSRPTLQDRVMSDGRWYFTLTVASVGLFAWVPFLHVAARTGDHSQRRRAAVYGAAAVGLVALTGLTPTDEAGNPVGAVSEFFQVVLAIAAIFTITMACVQLRPLRRAAYPAQPSMPVTAPPTDHAVAAALSARQRRQTTRELAERDANLAHELKIGRPDLGGDYKDGGLVDLNSAPLEVLVSVGGLDESAASRLVEAREQWGTGFASLREVLAYVDFTEREEGILRDRAVVLPR